MTLSCSCDYDYPFEPGDWHYEYNPTIDFEPLNTKRRRRCCSCKVLIDIGSICLEHPRVRYPYDELESRKKLSSDLDNAMCGEAPIRIASYYHCEKCGEIFLNLQSVGFECIAPDEYMPSMLTEYQDDYEPPKMEKAS